MVKVKGSKSKYGPFTVRYVVISDQTGLDSAPVHGVEHLNGDKYRQSHGHGVRVVEDLAVDSLEVVSATQAGQMMGLYTIHIYYQQQVIKFDIT